MMPLDSIHKMKGKEVIVSMKNGDEIEGKLISFDLQQNCGIEIKGELVFIQGGMTSSVRLK